MKVEQTIEIKSGRVHEIWKRWHSLQARDQDSWGKLFKSERYKRRVVHTERVGLHGHLMVERALRAEGLNWKRWRVERMGSNKLLDVQTGVRQWYVIRRLDHE